MKKALLTAALAALILCQFLPVGVKAAETQYAVIADSETYIYADKSLAETEKLFILPKTYYVKITGEYETCYSVQYMESADGLLPVAGFVRKEKLLLKVPETKPYYFSVKLSKKGNPSVFERPDETGAVSTVILSGSVQFYGKYLDGNQTWLFVSAQGIFGYVKAQEFEEFSLPNHPDYKEPPPPVEDPDDSTTGPDPITKTQSIDEFMQILLIVLICIPAVILVFLLFKGSKKNTHGEP